MNKKPSKNAKNISELPREEILVFPKLKRKFERAYQQYLKDTIDCEEEPSVEPLEPIFEPYDNEVLQRFLSFVRPGRGARALNMYMTLSATINLIATRRKYLAYIRANQSPIPIEKQRHWIYADDLDNAIYGTLDEVFPDQIWNKKANAWLTKEEVQALRNSVLETGYLILDDATIYYDPRSVE